MSLKGRMMPNGITAVKAEYLPINAEWIHPEEADGKKAVLYFHGGGFALSNGKSQQSIISNFVTLVGYKTLLFDYHLVPEFPADAAVNDSAEIYLWMLEQGYRPEDISFAGDSSGGGIELGTLVKLKDKGIPMPAACVAFSPSLDSTPSPLLADLTGLPPIMIHVGNDEVQRDYATSFGERADFYGVDIRVKIWKGMSLAEDAAEAMKQADSFIKHNMYKESRITSAYLYMTMLLPF